MLFAIMGEDIPDSLALRLSVRPAHLARIEELNRAGRLLLAGPFPVLEGDPAGVTGFTGSLIVAEFDSLEACQAWARTDPYVEAGVYARVTIKPFKKVLP
ncbi:MAG: YciI family protein [Magnetococcus sp. YQC-9]